MAPHLKNNQHWQLQVDESAPLNSKENLFSTQSSKAS